MLPTALLCLAALSAPPMQWDVALNSRYELHGQTSPQTVVTLENKVRTTRVTSDAQGRFAVRVPAGLYVVRVGDYRCACLAWAPGTAPPVASAELRLPTPVVRGQAPVRDTLWRLDDLTWPVIIVGGLGLSGWAAIDGSGS